MQSIEKIKAILADTLRLGEKASLLCAETRLIGHLHELDSMTVVSVIASLEEHFDIVFDDAEISAVNFESVGSLAVLVDAKLSLAE